MRITIFQAGDMPGDVSIRGWRRIMKAASLAAGMYYETHLKALHFQEGAEAKYGYRPRTDAYLRRKRRGWVTGPSGQKYRVPGGGRLPLVYTGRTRSAVMRPHIPRAFPTRVTIDMPTPRYVQMRPRRPNRPNMGQEIVTTTPAEVREMARIHAETMERELQNYRENTRRRIG